MRPFDTIYDQGDQSLVERVLGAASLIGISTVLYGNIIRSSEKLKETIAQQAAAASRIVFATREAFNLGYAAEIISSMGQTTLNTIAQDVQRYRFQRYLPIKQLGISPTVSVSREWVGKINTLLAAKHGGYTPEEVAAQTLGHDISAVATHLENDYPGILQVLEQTSAKYRESTTRLTIDASRLKEVYSPQGNYYVVPVIEYVGDTLGEATVTRRGEVVLPVLRTGVVNIRGSRYMPVRKASFSVAQGERVLVTKHMGRQTVEAIKKSLQFKSLLTESTTLLDRVIAAVDNSVSVTLAGESMPSINTFMGIITKPISLPDVRTITTNRPYWSLAPSFTALSTVTHKTRVLEEVYDSVGKKTKLTDVGQILLQKSSDSAFTTKGKVRVVRISPTDVFERPYSQSPFRPLMQSGFPRKPYTKQELAAKLGLVERDTLESLVKARFAETIPGGIGRIAVYFGAMPLPNIGEGSVVAFTYKTPQGSNLAKYTASVEESVIVKVTKDNKQLIERVATAKGSLPLIPAGTHIGIDIYGNEVRASSDTYIKSVERVAGTDELKVTLLREQKLGPGIKLGQDKNVVSMVNTHSEYKNNLLNFYQTKYKSIMNQKVYSPDMEQGLTGIRALANYLHGGLEYARAAEFLMDGKMALKRYANGRLGEGIVYKMLSDVARREHARFISQTKKRVMSDTEKAAYKKSVERRLHNLLRQAFGDSVANMITDIELVDDDWTIAPLTRAGGPEIDAIRGNYVEKLVEIETMVRKASEGDIDPLLRFIKDFREATKSQGLKPVSLRGDVGYYARMSNPHRISQLMYAPTFLIDHEHRKLVGLTFDTLTFVHAASAYKINSTASFNRSLGGFPGGASVTLDHIRNAELMGLHTMTNWLVRLLDYNYPYLADKVIAGISPILSDSEMKALNNGMLTIGGIQRKVHVIRGETLFGRGNTIGERLVKNFYQQATIAGAVRLDWLGEVLANPHQYMPKNVADDFLSGKLSTLSELVQNGSLGKNPNSLGLIDEDTMKGLIEIVNNAPKDAVVYIELPEELTVQGQRARYIPVSRFVPEDMFKLELNPLHSQVGRQQRSYYTGSKVHTQTVNLFMNVAKFWQDAHAGKHAQQTSELEAQTRAIAVENYLNTIRAMSGKNNPIIKRLFSLEAPFSKVAQLAQLSTLAHNEVAMTEDAFIALLTNSRYTSRKQLESEVAKADQLRGFERRARALATDLDAILDKEGSEEYNAVKQRVVKLITDRAPSKIVDEKAELIYHRLKYFFQNEWDNLPTSLKKMLRSLPGIGDKQLLENYAAMNVANDMAKVVKRTRAIKDAVTGWLKVAKPHDVAVKDAARYLKLVDDVKAGKTYIGGRLQGTPELSELSGRNVRIRPMTAKELETILGEELVKQNYNVDDLIFTSKETALAMNRDFDRDVVALYVETFGALEREFARKDSRVNLARDYRLGSKSIVAMQSEHIARTAIESVVEITREGDKIKYRPASLSSNTMMAALKENALKESMYAVPVKTFIVDQLAHSGITFANEKEKNRAIRRIMRMVGKYIDTDTKNAHVLVSEGLIPEKFEAVWKKISPKIVISAEAVEEGAPLRQQSELALRARDEIVAGLKGEFRRYMEDTEREAVERFPLIKRLTPEAYNTRTAILEALTLVNVAADKKRDVVNTANAIRGRLTYFADKVIAQNTISSKHGNPNVLRDIKKTLQDLELPRDGAVPPETLSKLASGNFIVEVGDNEQRRIAAYGFKAESIDFATYDEYLRLREDIASFAVKKHNELLEEFGKIVSTGKGDDKVVQDYIARMQTGMKSYRIMAPSSMYAGKTLGELDPGAVEKLTFGWAIVSPSVAEIEYRTSKDAVKVSGKFFKTYIEAVHGSKGAAVYKGLSKSIEKAAAHDPARKLAAVREIQDHFASSTTLFENLHAFMLVYREVAPGSTVFKRGAEQAATSFEPRVDISIGDSIENALGAMTSSSPPKRLASPNIVDRLTFRLATFIGKAHDIRVGTPSSETAEAASEVLANRFRRISKARVAEMMAREISPFDPMTATKLFGEAAEQLAKKGEAVAASRAASRMRGIALAAGAFMGLIAGQFINQSVSGYAVPGIATTAGGGGERLDRGIIGKTPEILLPERPVRVTPWDDVERAALQDLDFVEYNAPLFALARQDKQQPPQFRSKYRGITVG